MNTKRFSTILVPGLGLALLLGLWMSVSRAAALQKPADPVSSRVSDGARETTLAVQTCSDWNLASDFRRSPNQENPNRDSCGNPDVWHFMESADLNRDPQTYSLLPYYASSSSGIQGLEKWSGSSYLPPPDGLPAFGINTTGVTQTVSYEFPPDVINAHPGVQRLAIAAWRSPVTGSVTIAGSVRDLDANGGDGILWYIDKGGTNLAAGSIANGGSQEFSDGTGGEILAEVAVDQGDFIYFGIHPNGDLYYDSTELDISIHLLTPLLATKHADPTSVRPGEQLTYTIRVTNTTPLALQATLTDTLPISLTYTSGSLAAGSGSYGYESGVITWTGSVSAGRAVSITFGATVSRRVPCNTSLTNSVVISGGGQINARTAVVVVEAYEIYLPGTTRNYCTPLYADDFGDPASGWPVGETTNVLYEYSNGEYRILVKNANRMGGARPGFKASDYIVGVDVRNVSGVYGSYGLAFGLSDDWSQFYLFEIFPDRTYALWRYRYGAGWALLAGGESDGIYPDTYVNRLKIERSGWLIRAYANGRLLASVSDGSYTDSRHVGLMAFSYDWPAVDVRFDDFVVYAAACGAGVTAIGETNQRAEEATREADLAGLWEGNQDREDR